MKKGCYVRKMEIKLKRGKKFYIGVIIIIFLLIVKSSSAYFGSDKTSEDAVFGIIRLLCILPPLLYGTIFYFKGPSKIIIDSEVLTVERVFSQPIIIPLTTIRSIKKHDYGYNLGGVINKSNEVYVVKYGKKIMNLDPISFGLARVSLDMFVNELNNRVEYAKEVSSGDGKLDVTRGRG